MPTYRFIPLESVVLKERSARIGRELEEFEVWVVLRERNARVGRKLKEFEVWVHLGSGPQRSSASRWSILGIRKLTRKFAGVSPAPPTASTLGKVY